MGREITVDGVKIAQVLGTIQALQILIGRNTTDTSVILARLKEIDKILDEELYRGSNDTRSRS